MKRFQSLPVFVFAVWCFGASSTRATTVIGDLNNFDTVNDTGQVCYGFEIEISDIHSTDVTYTFDWNHYGPPKIREDNTDPAHPKVFVRYESTKDVNGSWGANGSFTNMVIPSITPPAGHSCTDVSVNEGCEHFGVGYYGATTSIKYTWLVDGGAALVTFGAPVGVATPSWTYTPPAPAQPAQVVAAIPAPVVPIPAGKRYGEPSWVKVVKTTTHNAARVELADLTSDDKDSDGLADWQNKEPDEIETEWKLLQGNNDGNAAKAELAGAADDMGDGSEQVTRRYEFYRYGADPNTLDGETGEAMCSEVNPTVDPLAPNYLHGLGDHVAVTDVNGETYYVDCAAQVVVGTYIGAQMAGFAAKAPLGLIDNLQDGNVGQSYTARTVVVGGDSPYTIIITGGSLPDGLVLGDRLDPDTGLIAPGVLSGTAAVGGDFTFTVEVTDAANVTASKPYSLHVNGGVATTSTTMTVTTTTTTTSTLPPLPTCTMGAGLVQAPPRSPKNTGLVKVRKGLTATPATKSTTLTISGTLEHCENFPPVPGAAGPITGGSFKATLEIVPGSTCAGFVGSVPVKSSLKIAWTTPNLSRPGKLKTVATEKTILGSYAQPGTNPIVLSAVAADFGVKSKVPGFGNKHATLSMTMDQTPAQIAAACGDPKAGLAILTFTGVNGAATLSVQ